MTSMTRLPTGTPVSPLTKPGTTSAGFRAKLNGVPAEVLDGQVVLKTCLVRQFTATYWATTVWLLASLGPEPWIRVLVISLLGGVFLGMVIVGAAPVAAFTDGRLPPPPETCLPVAEAVGVNDLIRSSTQTVVSLPLTPSWLLPEVPYPYLGGSTASTRLPMVWPLMALARPVRPMLAGSTCGTAV